MATHLKWTFHHPKATEYHIGYIGQGLTEHNPKSAREQIADAYPFGGWSPFGVGEWRFVTLGSGTVRLKYPGDPPMEPIASAKLRDERIYVFRSDIWAIVQPDGSFEVARLD